MQEKEEKERKQKAAQDQEAKKREEEEQMSKLEGSMLILLGQLRGNCTPFECSVSEMELGQARTRILAQWIAYNSSLLSIHMSRKGIQDNDG